MGGGMAATSHFTKAGTRALINTSPEPVTNWGASITEDVAVFGGLWIALNNPILFLVLLAVFIVLVIWLLPKIWRLLIAIFRKIGSWLGLVDKSALEPALASGPTETASSTIAEQLGSLQQLHEAGTLSDAEFDQAKKKLLDG